MRFLKNLWSRAGDLAEEGTNDERNRYGDWLAARFRRLIGPSPPPWFGIPGPCGPAGMDWTSPSPRPRTEFLAHDR